MAGREYMQEVQKTKETVISREILISQATQKPSLMIATPVKVPGAPERYLGISVNIDNLQEIVALGKKSDSNYSFAFDGKTAWSLPTPFQRISAHSNLLIRMKKIKPWLHRNCGHGSGSG